MIYLNVIAITLFVIAAVIPNNKKFFPVQPAKKYQSISGFALIVDGDSIKINNQNIRLIGIDAPEYQQKCFDKNMQQYQCGMVAMNFLKNLISKQYIICQYHKKDIYNRILGECQLNKININQRMVAEGWAILYDFPRASKEMQKLEIEAKKHKKGLWQGSFLEPKKYRKRNFGYK